MKLYMLWKEWRKNRARKILRDEIKEIPELRAGIDTAKKQAEGYKSQAEQERQRANNAEQELETSSQAYIQSIKETSEREQQTRREKEEFIKKSNEVIESSRKTLEQLINAQKAATAEILMRNLPEHVKELGLEKGVLESYKQQRAMIESLLKYSSQLSDRILIEEAELLESQQPKLSNWPIAVARSGDLIYSTKKFKKRLRNVPKQLMLEKIEEREVYQNLCRGKEASIQVQSSRGEIYNLALIPHMQKGRDLPEAVFIYLNPPERAEIGKAVGKVVREMKRNMYQKLDKILSRLPELPKLQGEYH